MSIDSKELAEVFGLFGCIITNYSTMQQTVHCIKSASCKGIPWESLRTRCLAILLFMLSTWLYGGPISVFLGNMFGFANTIVVMAIKWREEKDYISILQESVSIVSQKFEKTECR